MSTLGERRIALVHDELTRRGGAEVVFEELLRLYPEADVYALYCGQPVIAVDGRRYDVKTSFLQKWPTWWRRHPRRLLPLLPYAAEQLDFSSYDLVISSASGFVKSIVTRANVPHICYCHTPTRYLWDATHEVIAALPRWSRWPGSALLHYLRLSDFAAAQRVDYFIANSHWTSERLLKHYRRRSTVVYPPVDTAFFTPDSSTTARGDFFLCVGRLTPTKYFDQAVQVCEKLGLPLKIVGTGREMARLKRLAGSRTELLGKVSQAELRDLYRSARALLQPGEEDFGIAAVEAQACGTPVIALRRGGASEAVREGETGYLYLEARVEALAEALRGFLTQTDSLKREDMQQHALKFSRNVFQRSLQTTVEGLIDRYEQRAV